MSCPYTPSAQFHFVTRMLLAAVVSAATLIPFASISAQQAGSVDKVGTSQMAFDIPFALGSDRESIVQVRLHVSTDQGRTWNLAASRPPTGDRFPFQAERTGEYWFAIQTVSRDGHHVPVPGHLKPDLKIVIDQQDPELTFSVRADAAGRIVASLEAYDTNIDPTTIEIQYRDAAAPDTAAWIPVPARSDRQSNAGKYFDEVAWWPQSTAGAFNVRASIRDLAGNAAGAVHQVVMPATRPASASLSAAPATRSTTVAAAEPPASEQDSIATRYRQTRLPVALEHLYGSTPDASVMPSSATIVQTNPSAAGAGDTNASPAQTSGQRVADNRLPGVGAPSAAAPDRSANGWRSRDADGTQASSQVASSTTDAMVAAANNTEIRLAASQWPSDTSQSEFRQSRSTPSAPINVAAVPQEGVQQDRFSQENAPPQPVTDPTNAANAVWSSSTTGNEPVAAGPQPTSLVAAGPVFEKLRAMARHSNARQFQMDYAIDAIGPDGVKDVEMWFTRDGAQTWQRLAVDPDRRSPFDIVVDSDGIFGFRIRVVSNEGLSSRPPRSGDPADIWVNVDTVQPQASIEAAPYGNGAEAGMLMIQWKANDTNLTERPIKLAYSQSPDGPWTTIDAALRNTGEFAWKPSMDTPDQVFLRLEVRDEAGNVTIDQPRRPVDISGLIPRGHIRGITPIRAGPGDRPVPKLPNRDTGPTT